MFDDFDHYDPCEHEDYDVDWEGRARCHCGHSWWLTSEQLSAQARAIHEYAEWEYREARKFNRWWKRLGRWIYYRLPLRSNQEIPF